jgi:predicted nucleic acid-binding protein
MTFLDTCFLVDILRDARSKRRGPATRLLADLEDEDLWIGLHVACELHVGIELSQNPAREKDEVAGLLDSMQVAYPDQRFPAVYGRLLAELSRKGESVPAMDLLIATSAIVEDAPLATRDRSHFVRVPGLRLITY